MKLLGTFFLSFTISLVCNAQYTWHALPAAPVSLRFDDFHFINPDTGWAINPNYSFYTASPQFARVFRTYDGGNSWQKLKDNSITYYRSVGFADVNTGWIGNLADTSLQGTLRYTTDTIPLYQTTDGGNTWTPASLPNPHPAGICGISVVTDSIVYAYGRFSSPAGYIKTINKGTSWTFVSLDSLAFGLIDGHFFGKDTGFITAMAADHRAAILFTNDGGTTWRYCYHSVRSDSDRVWKIFFPTRNIGYASIEYGGTHITFNTYFLKTTNGGQTWTEMPFIASFNEEGIGFVNDSVGWIGGDGTRGTYITRDGGYTWNTDESFGLSTPPFTTGTAGFRMNRFRSFGDTLMYASGNTIYKLKPGTTGIRDAMQEDNTVRSFPNPFSNETTITYDLNHTAKNVTVEVQNIVGKTVFFKNIGEQGQGSHKLSFDEYLPAGVYYFSVISEQFRSTVKMVVIH